MNALYSSTAQRKAMFYNLVKNVQSGIIVQSGTVISGAVQSGTVKSCEVQTGTVQSSVRCDVRRCDGAKHLYCAE